MFKMPLTDFLNIDISLNAILRFNCNSIASLKTLIHRKLLRYYGTIIWQLYFRFSISLQKIEYIIILIIYFQSQSLVFFRKISFSRIAHKGSNIFAYIWFIKHIHYFFCFAVIFKIYYLHIFKNSFILSGYNRRNTVLDAKTQYQQGCAASYTNDRHKETGLIPYQITGSNLWCKGQTFPDKRNFFNKGFLAGFWSHRS